MNTTYEKILKILTSREKFHINLGLERVTSLLQLLNNPQENLKIIHVAGTNGKGSTCAILSRILTVAGYKTGLYTSPHIIEYTERIKINNINISYEDLYKYVFEIDKLSKENNIYLTEFEILTCCAYKYFADQKTDICIIETGLGGRLDATNVIKKNILSIITSLSLDHTDRLGKTIENIAYEKAGIIKKNCPIIINNENKGLDVVKNIAKQNNSDFITARNINKLIFENNKNYIIYNDKKLNFALLGLWQKDNIELALETIHYLNKNGFIISETALENGLKSVNWPFRMQYIQQYNLLLDGTHNPDGARVLKESIDYYFPNTKRTWIYGSINTKDYKKITKILFDKNDEVFLYNFKSPNAVPYDELKKIIPSANPINSKDLSYLIQEKKDSLIIICGSFYMLGEILKINNFLKKTAMVVNIF